MAKAAEILEAAIVERNDALKFASRTLENLRFIESMCEGGHQEAASRVHLVTHIVNSLLGVVVFTFEKNFVRFALKEKVVDLVNRGWPAWNFALGGLPGDTLGELAYHLRNGAAHARLNYSSDSPDPSEVVITVEDADPKTKKVYWRGMITAADLLRFCYRYGEHIEEVIG